MGKIDFLSDSDFYDDEENENCEVNKDLEFAEGLSFPYWDEFEAEAPRSWAERAFGF